ncbi:MAG TPA: SGNH/GDSL hydrolase family protein [Candidatus Limnocylindrales bacterium]|nr:SGNH/GDSL hydrolase family protein [Candidatus Limnocylindrales bacterium]
MSFKDPFVKILTTLTFLIALILIPVDPVRLYRAKPVKIMPLGDSITQSDSQHNSYRRNLWQKLKADGYNIDFVGSQKENFGGPPPNPDFDLDHEGHWGWRVDQILEKIDGWATTYQPDIVLIHLGHNDLGRGHSISSTVQELGEIIDILRRQNAHIIVLLAQIIPTYPPSPAIQKLNAEISRLAMAKNTRESPVLLVNQAEGFDAREDTFDGLHPNESGEEKMATRWYTALVKVLRSKTNPP